MSLLLNTIKAFPRGRSLEELYVLLQCSFDDAKRMAIQIELDELVRNGEARKDKDGKWRPVVRLKLNSREDEESHTDRNNGVKQPAVEPQSLYAAHASFRSERTDEQIDEDNGQDVRPDPNALLRYWRSALRADPRGSITQAEDRHGVSWHLITGAGPVVPSEGEKRVLSIQLDDLMPEFRQALMRREANENAFAIGWPIAIGRKSGAPAVWPVGLFAAEWIRTENLLEIHIEANDVLVNPDWLKGTARSTGWSANELKEVFEPSGSVGLQSDIFLTNLREAAAGSIRGRITGEDLLSQVDIEAVGIYDIAAVFLPSDSSFTAGAVRDLDTIATWPEERLARTALAPLLGITPDITNDDTYDINPEPVNAEQIKAVRNACSIPLSVVTGPPGTGKSQAIVSMAASILTSGGSVLVASKNHQALDAVEDRLNSIAPTIPFMVRTLDPDRDVDTSLTDVLKELITAPSSSVYEHDEALEEELRQASIQRSTTLDALNQISDLECRIADLIERIHARKRIGSKAKIERDENNGSQDGFLSKLLQWIVRVLTDRLKNDTEAHISNNNIATGTSTSVLEAELNKLRTKRGTYSVHGDPVTITDQIAKLTRELLPRILATRTNVPEQARIEITNQKDDLEFAATNAPLPNDLAREVLSYRPLWLASVLGTPKRLPLDDGLFDLVVFDEASQCDIASSLPLFARAKRAVVVGDDRQLSFIPQIGQAQDKNLMQAQGLPVTNMARYAQSKRSLFDFALRIPETPRVLLRHQYRSAAPIVDYISKEYYGGKLTASFDPDTLIVPKSQKAGLAWTHVSSPSVPEKGNVNRREATAIAEHLKTLLIDQSYVGSVGVIAPFRGQVHLLENTIRSSLPEQKLVGADLRVATVDGFQGQERDLILFSPCLGTASASSALTFVQRDLRRLNVAISRARAIAHIFGDLDFAKSGKIRALAKLAAIATEPAKKSGEGVFDSEWERRVFHALKQRDLESFPQYEIAGRRLDFALFGPGEIKLDLEVDGRRWHQDADGNRKISDHWRDHQMQSMGWRVRRFWVDELEQDMESCLDLVEQDLS